MLHCEKHAMTFYRCVACGLMILRNHSLFCRTTQICGHTTCFSQIFRKNRLQPRHHTAASASDFTALLPNLKEWALPWLQTPHFAFWEELIPCWSSRVPSPITPTVLHKKMNLNITLNITLDTCITAETAAHPPCHTIKTDVSSPFHSDTWCSGGSNDSTW